MANTKTEKAKAPAIPAGLAASFKASSELSGAYLLGDAWFFNEATAKKHFENYQFVPNPHAKK